MSENNILRAITIFAATFVTAISLLTINGCAAHERVVTQTVYKDVYIPVPCDILEPAEPEKQENVVMAVIELKAYTERLKAAFRACKGETNR